MVTANPQVSDNSVFADEFIKKLPPKVKEQVELLRKIILSSSEQIKEEIKHGIPFYMFKGQMCYINPFDNKIVLGFSRGADMPDEYNMLSGGGKAVRHAVIRVGTKIDEDKIRHLIYEALIVNEMKADKSNRK
jgi:hypothetical protein